MTSSDQIDALAKRDATRHRCCRCNAPASVYHYKAFFCGDECAERVSDWTLEDGQQHVPNYLEDLNTIHDFIMHHIVRGKSIVKHRSNEELFQEQLDRVSDREQVPSWHFTAENYAEAVLRTLGAWKE